MPGHARVSRPEGVLDGASLRPARATARRISGRLALVAMVVFGTAQEIPPGVASAAHRGVKHSGLSVGFPAPPSDYMVSIPCADFSHLVAGAPCAQTNAQVPFVSPALHPDVFERSAKAESAPPGTSLRVEFFNAGCAESPAIRVSLVAVTRASRTASPVVSGAAREVGTLAPAAPGHWAERVVFTMPDLGQTTAFRYPTRHAEVVLSFSGTLAPCEASGSVVHGYFEIRRAKEAGCSSTRSTQASAGGRALPKKCVPDLQVAVKAFGGGISGLSFDKAGMTGSFLVALPVAFGVAPPERPSDRWKCLSGCSKIQITVTDSHGKRVQGAEISASVTPLTGGVAPYEHPSDVGTGHLCLATTSSLCGKGPDSYLTGGLTDLGGQLALFYWPPGMIGLHRFATVTVQARLGKAQSPKRSVRVDVSPNVIFPRAPTSLPVPENVLAAVAAWSQAGGALAFAAGQAPNPIQDLLEHAVGLAGGSATPVKVAFAVKDLVSQQNQEKAITALFLEQFGLSPWGLGETGTTAPTASFIHEIAGQGGVSDLFTTGLIVKWGQAIAQSPTRKESMKLRVYDVSYCAQDQDCGPAAKQGTTPAGIRPLLYIEFQASSGFRESLLVPYNPAVWMRQQFG